MGCARVLVWIVVIVVLGDGVALAVDPATKPAAPPRRSFDGCPLPEITAIPLSDAVPPHVKLSDISKLLGRDPAALGVKIFNFEKSADIMSRRLTYFVPVTSQSLVPHDNNMMIGSASRTEHMAIKHVGNVATKWFAIDISSADLAGLELDNGLVSKIILFYKNQKQAEKLVSAEFPGGLDGTGWVAVRDGDAGRLEISSLRMPGRPAARVPQSAVASPASSSPADVSASNLFASGSGFLITADGYFLTNKRVADERDCKFRVRFDDGNEKDASVVAVDDQQDLALMHVEAAGATPFLKLSNFDTPNPATKVMALGYAGGAALGFQMQVATGGVTSISPADESPVVLTLDTTHGNKGGPIIDKDANVVGILSPGQHVDNANAIRAMSVGQIKRFFLKAGDKFPVQLSPGPTTRPVFDGEQLAKDARRATLLVLLYKPAPPAK